MEETGCPLCRRVTKTNIWVEAEEGKVPFIYRRCRDCGFVFLSLRPDEEEILEYYAHEYYGEGSHKFQSWLEAFRVFFAWKRMRRTQKFFSRPGKALDIGCGQGTFLQLLQREGWECHGTELTPGSARRASQRGIPVSVGEIPEDQFPPHSFDLVSFWQVLEHLRDPMKVLKGLRPLMKKGGIVAISTPNIESLQAKVASRQWFHLDPPRHLCLFSPKTLARMMKSLGFHTLEIHHFSMEQNPFGWLQSFLNLMGLPENSLYGILKVSSNSARRPLCSWQKAKTLLLAGGLLPHCLFLSALMALFRRGGTIEAYFQLKEI
jgi:2-polyprenyl-3-methyl-5-hydroxy-6-metoxy-1,4-benzoquinol methylase